MKKGRIRYELYILIQSVVYGFGNPLTKVAYQSITPLYLLAVRFGLAALVLFVPFHKRILAAARKTPVRIWLPSSLCCAGAYISCNFALNLTTATNVGFIMSLPVLFAPVLSAFVLGRRYEIRRLPIQLFAILGVFLLCCNGGVFRFGAGELLALVDACCLAGQLVFGERAMKEMDVFDITALQILITAVISIVSAPLTGSPSALAEAEPAAWMTAVYLALVCTIFAYLIQNSAVTHLSSQTVSMLQCTQPILTAVFSFFLLHETLSLIGFAGGVVIVGSLLLDSRAEGAGQEALREADSKNDKRN